ncbi:FG-GAP repeat domain-containing protein [Streptomyces sp. NPDC059142]|uniref:FG-GAP repeat domain-containing protein n=1 Tax=Streptomyces sp. NPDC059142 TaxID=3346739 RepID=UPI003678E177
MRIRRIRRIRTTGATAGRPARTRSAAVALSACTALLLPLTACTSSGPSPASPTSPASSSEGSGGSGGSGGSTEAKNGDTAPGAGATATARRAVPRGRGSRLPDDLNGDGHPDLVLNDLVTAAGDTYGDDAGIGIVYGAKGATPFDPAVRQTLDPRERGARVDGVLPAAFDAVAACDLDGDGFGDLIIATDPPYNGIGTPPVPLQILFGGPQGPTGRAVVLKIPAKARAGDEWPDHPVCGDFDGVGAGGRPGAPRARPPPLRAGAECPPPPSGAYFSVLGAAHRASTASGGRVSFLRGPFDRTGAPRAAAAPVPGGGPVLTAPEPKSDANGDGYDDLVVVDRPRAPGAAARGTLLLGGPNGPERTGGAYRFTELRKPPAPRLPGVPAGKAATEVLRATDGYLATRTHRAETSDLVALYAPAGSGAPAYRPHPLLTFSTTLFLD